MSPTHASVLTRALDSKNNPVRQSVDELMNYLQSRPDPTAAGLLALATTEAVAELTSLLQIARTNLLAELEPEPSPWFVGPTFTASRWLRADADLIAGTTLVEIKSNLGSNRSDGTRQAQLDLRLLRQLIGYVLHDVDDRYRLSAVAIYSARYGALMVRPLGPFLDQLAGRSVELPATRSAYKDLLGAL